MTAPTTTPLSPLADSPAGGPVGDRARPSRFAGLDGLRAIAVLLVIVYHLSPGAMPGGYLGVDIFFVLSGFLITTLLLREKDTSGRIHVGNFWRRRARRLLPALGLLLLVCGTAAWAIGGDVLVGLGRQLAGAATFSSNWVALGSSASYFDESTPQLFRNLWSLAVEEQFYLLWPLIIMALLVLKPRWLRTGVVAALAIASALAMALLFVPAGDATRVYFGTDTHSFGLALGATLALVLAGRQLTARWLRLLLPPLGAVAVALLIAASFVMPADASLPYRGGLALVAVLSATAILGSITPGSWLGCALDVQPLRWIGERSYGLYLWHWPVLVLLSAALPEWHHSGASGWLLGGLALVITVAAAAASYRYLEQPVRILGFRGAFMAAERAALPGRLAVFEAEVSRPRLRFVSGLAVVSLVIAGGVATVAAVIADPGKTSVQAQIELGQQAIESEAPTPPAKPEESPEKTPAALPGGEQISAIGDSVMLASAKELQNSFPGIDIDAAVSRQLSTAPELIRARIDAGTLRPIVLLGLGTNGPITAATLAEVRDIIGGKHQLVVINAYAPRSWTDGVNATLSAFAQQYRDVDLANWHDSIAAQTNLLAGDKIHPGDAGGRVYAAAVRDALQRLAELPPLLGPRDYGLAPQPI